jgi:hypothetical protein
MNDKSLGAKKIDSHSEHQKIIAKLEAELKVLKTKESHAIRKFKFHHKFIFAILVFLGVILLWSGVWQIVTTIPGLDNPYISSGAGILLLLILGYFYNNVL